MLRRIASHLLWTACNLERAEWRARLLDVNYHLLIESPPRDAQPWAPLLAIFGERELFAETYTTADDASILNFFALDTDNPNSIRSCINTARNNAISLRHYISSELWLDLNTLYLNAQEWTPELFVSPGVFAFFLSKASARRLHQSRRYSKAKPSNIGWRACRRLLRSQPRRIGLGSPPRARPLGGSIPH